MEPTAGIVADSVIGLNCGIVFCGVAIFDGLFVMYFVSVVFVEHRYSC